MAKLYFRYGAMGSSKTANALMVRYNYFERDRKVILLKPKIDTRDGERTITSRIGLSAECDFVEDFIDYAKTHWMTVSGPTNDIIQLHDNTTPRQEAAADWQQYACIIIDEAQFMEPWQVDFMAHLVDFYRIPVICYGLRTDFRNVFFPGAHRLMELADAIEQIPTVCWCGKKAHCNARIFNGKIIHEGEQVFLGGNESYIALCRKHYTMGLIKKPPEIVSTDGAL